MSDPFAIYTSTGDRLLLLTPEDCRRAWLSAQLARLAEWLTLTRSR